MAIPDFQTLMLPVLKRIARGCMKSADLVDAIAADFDLSAEERTALLPSGTQATIANRTHWAIAYMSKAGLITRVARGQYVVSDRGAAVLKSPPERITISFLTRFPEFDGFRTDASRASRKPNDDADGPSSSSATQTSTPEERLEIADRELRDALAAALLTRVRSLHPSAFEQLIVDLLVKMGYGGSRREAAERLGRSGDGGIDGVVREDALGLDAIYVQAKRYAEDNAIGAPVIQGFAGALLSNGATKGVFVTTSRFTQQARDMAAGYKAHRIILIDGAELARLMIRHDVGVRTVQTLRVQRIDLELYEDLEAS